MSMAITTEIADLALKQQIVRTEVDIVGIYNSSKMNTESIKSIVEECGYSMIQMGQDIQYVVYKSNSFNFIQQQTISLSG